MEPVYAGMLRELGIAVEPSEILQPEDEASPEPESEYFAYEAYERPQYEASWAHMQQCCPDAPQVPYKRSTHFLSHLNQLTGRNGVDALPRGTLSRLKRAGVRTDQPHAYFRIRRLFKRWGFSSPEYRHIFAVLRHLGGPVLSLTYAQERRIRRDFDYLCELFETTRPMGHARKAFPSYYLTLQLLLKKYNIPSFYLLPSIKDAAKFARIVDVYCVLSDASIA